MNIFHYPTSKMNDQKGFTLVETLVAILILVVSVTALMTVAKNNFSIVRYARNQMIATTLMQESLEYIRSTRDTLVQQATNGDSWAQWNTLYQSCFTKDGCFIDPYASQEQRVTACPDGGCPNITYCPNAVFYGYSRTYKNINDPDCYITPFARTVTMQTITPAGGGADQVVVTSHVDWLNGAQPVTQSQSIVIANWTP